MYAQRYANTSSGIRTNQACQPENFNGNGSGTRKKNTGRPIKWMTSMQYVSLIYQQNSLNKLSEQNLQIQ